MTRNQPRTNKVCAEDEQDYEWEDSKRDAEAIKDAVNSGLRQL
jgi:hypothetical protein